MKGGTKAGTQILPTPMPRLSAFMPQLKPNEVLRGSATNCPMLHINRRASLQLLLLETKYFISRELCVSIFSPRCLQCHLIPQPRRRSTLPDYKDQVGGIIPGYAGHMPRSRDKYAGSAHGGIAPERGPPPAMGAQQGHLRPEDVIPPRFEAFIANERGVMPGYTGFRPEARHVHNVSAFGGIVSDSGLFGNARDVSGKMGGLAGATQANSFEELSQGNRTFDWRRDPLRTAAVSGNVGVVPGTRVRRVAARPRLGGLSGWPMCRSRTATRATSRPANGGR